MTNTKNSYGGLARFFHWAIALLILTAFALGIIGDNMPRNAETVDTLKTLYSVHKTVGVTVFILAVLRIIWAIVQPRPVPLHPEKKLETLAAEVMHWALYGALVVVPLSGWVMHAAEVGFANIWWPFGQGLPFVPKSEAVSHAAGAVHGVAVFVLLGAVVAHIAGAVKHVVIDKDDTMARMTKGVSAGDASTSSHSLIAPLAGLGLWVIVIGGALAGNAMAVETAAAPAEVEATQDEPSGIMPVTDAPEWTVTDGRLSFKVAQSGAPIEGVFDTWNAQITYDVDTGLGTVSVNIDTTSLTLGSVTSTAKGPEFFNTDAYTTSIFEAEIARIENGPAHVATGDVTLIGQTVPVLLEFDLQVDGTAAKMTGQALLDRRDFGMGQGYADESTVGFAVDITVELTAQRAE
ncbi:cytochrome b561 [Pacificibacter maritimus]|uniref:Cytochrome b561 n=1 Tax=Pacificibacter maritimus TaxID=762213 RepID=A0A3N4V0D5_9RHOB|nr:cytochrome b/b6 domain-containing protein [Pacificibacter maritimus]RPE66374.1 cytochrome b561 [Pacificibacter maritimus]